MKSRLIRAVAVLAYYCRLDAFFYWLNRKAKRILTFHNVLLDSLFRAGIANGVSNRLSDFERIIDECAKRFKFSTDLFDVSTLTITFDDGYRNQYTTAFKALQKRGIPAYLFVAGNVSRVEREERVERVGGLVVDLLTHWIDNVPAGSYKLDFEGGQTYTITDENRLAIWSQAIWPAFMADAAGKGRTVLDACNRAYPIDKVLAMLPEEYIRERLSGITAEEREEMRKAGWQLGWHTQSHYPLAKLGEAELKEELDSPPEFKRVCLSYPYGNPVEVSETAIKLAEELGYPCAVSNTNEATPSRFFLPRMALLPDKDKYRLHFQLSGLEYFIKHRKLWPR